MVPPKRKHRKEDPFDTPEYRKLVDDLKKIIHEAAEKGVDFAKRNDILSCRHCKAYEDITFQGEWIIYDHSKKNLGAGEFILIDSKCRSYRRNCISYYKTTYESICTVCGAQQEEIVRDRFED